MHNPFEETNRYRLEQSVLSPNLFYVASTSTPERELTNSMWNIDQRAVLYPADIPTDENSLLTQYLYDNKVNKQMSAAVEVFWSQNKLIIESPLASGSGSNSALRSKFGLNAFKTSSSSGCGSGASSGGSSSHRKPPPPHNRYGGGSGSCVSSPLARNPADNLKFSATSSTRAQRGDCCSSVSSIDSGTAAGGLDSGVNKRDQACQTMFTFAPDVDLTQIEALRPFLFTDPSFNDKENIGHSPKRDRDKKDSMRLNDSIRKKLFDHNSEEYSTSTATNSMHFESAPVSPPPPSSQDRLDCHQFAHSSRNGSIKKKSSSSAAKKIRASIFRRSKNPWTVVTASSSSSSCTSIAAVGGGSGGPGTTTITSTKTTSFEQHTHKETVYRSENFLGNEDEGDDELDDHDDYFVFELDQKERNRRKLGQSSSSGDNDNSKIVCDIGYDLEQHDSVFVSDRPASPDLSPF